MRAWGGRTSPDAAYSNAPALSVNAVQRTHHSLVHYKRLCRGVAPARAGAPAAGVG